MNFWEAVQAMDEGKTVRMSVNPEFKYRLAGDGCTIVSKPLYNKFAYDGPEWRGAMFFSRHIRGDWEVIE